MEWLEKKNRKLYEERARKMDQEMSLKFSHQPKINSNSKKMAIASSTGGSFLERQQQHETRKSVMNEKMKKQMYDQYTHSPKLNFKSMAMTTNNRNSKLRLEKMDQMDEDAQFINTSAIKTSYFNPDLEFSRNMSNNQLTAVPAFDGNVGRWTQKQRLGSSKSKDSFEKYEIPKGGKQITSEDIEQLNSLPPEIRKRHLINLKRQMIGVKQQDGSYRDVANTLALFDQIDDNNHYFEDTKKYIEKNEEFAPASILKSKSSLVSQIGRAHV